jgi:hypothetical protein
MDIARFMEQLFLPYTHFYHENQLKISKIITKLSIFFFSQANQWCTRGIELLASQKIEKCSVSMELAEKSLQQIQQFIDSASDFCLATPRDFRNMFQDSTTVETKALVSQVCYITSIYTTLIFCQESRTEGGMNIKNYNVYQPDVYYISSNRVGKISDFRAQHQL